MINRRVLYIGWVGFEITEMISAEMSLCSVSGGSSAVWDRSGRDCPALPGSMSSPSPASTLTSLCWELGPCSSWSIYGLSVWLNRPGFHGNLGLWL